MHIFKFFTLASFLLFGSVAFTMDSSFDSEEENDKSEETREWSISNFCRSQYEGAVSLLSFGKSAAVDLAATAQEAALYHPINLALRVAFKLDDVEEFQRLLNHRSADLNYGAESDSYCGDLLWAEVY